MARGFDWSRARMQKLVAERGTTPVDDERPPLEPVISEGQRKAHRAARAALAKQFAALPLNERLRRVKSQDVV